ncbi:hypothetical protein [Runella sp.]|uniref:hypothetical protein n=1 Tax=Runella sp. TaxID=1960881 RepID=UPI003D0D36C8
MKKKEKYNSFHEMKASSTSITPANAAVVMERHDKFESFINSFRVTNSKSIATKSSKPAPKG